VPWTELYTLLIQKEKIIIYIFDLKEYSMIEREETGIKDPAKEKHEEYSISG
jgi:hypothetical protein